MSEIWRAAVVMLAVCTAGACGRCGAAGSLDSGGTDTGQEAGWDSDSGASEAGPTDAKSGTDSGPSCGNAAYCPALDAIDAWRPACDPYYCGTGFTFCTDQEGADMLFAAFPGCLVCEATTTWCSQGYSCGQAGPACVVVTPFEGPDFARLCALAEDGVIDSVICFPTG